MSYRILLCAFGFLAVMPCVHGQAVSSWNTAINTSLPQPVRPNENQLVSNTGSHPPVHHHSAPSEFHTRAMVGTSQVPPQLNPQLPAHQLLTAPQPKSSNDAHKHRHLKKHLPLVLQKHHGPVQAAVPMLPESNYRPTWKTPYSYGHFGASRTRHWSVHYGYRDRMTQWRLR